jgi:hypothetical protein
MNRNYYFCRCENCGWEGSSEYLYGGGQIGDTGDYGDAFCPVCDSFDLEDKEPSDSGNSIPKHIVILQIALLRCEYIFRNRAKDCNKMEKYTLLEYADECKAAIELSERARVTDEEETE